MPCQSLAHLEENASVLHQSREDEDDTSDDPGFHGCQTLGLGEGGTRDQGEKITKYSSQQNYIYIYIFLLLEFNNNFLLVVFLMFFLLLVF